MDIEERTLLLLTNADKEQFIHEGYLIVRGLIPHPLVSDTRLRLSDAMRIDANDPFTWEGKASFPADLDVIATTMAARTPAFESVAEQLVGPDFLRGGCFSPFLEWNDLPPQCSGYIPVLAYPSPGEQCLVPGGYHIDGGKYVTTFPERYFLAAMAYLTDVTEFGGATLVRPGSHRQVFEKWFADGHVPESPFAIVPELDYADPVPIVAEAGDVCFMHFLLVHSGSANRSATVRIGMNTAVMPNPDRPYQPKKGPPKPGWTPMDHSLRMDRA